MRVRRQQIVDLGREQFADFLEVQDRSFKKSTQGSFLKSLGNQSAVVEKEFALKERLALVKGRGVS